METSEPNKREQLKGEEGQESEDAERCTKGRSPQRRKQGKMGQYHDRERSERVLTVPETWLSWRVVS